MIAAVGAPRLQSPMTPIAFRDERGTRWTVRALEPLQPDEPRTARIVFTSESSEGRTCEACLPEGSTWEEVDERVWRALLRHADPGVPGAS